MADTFCRLPFSFRIRKLCQITRHSFDCCVVYIHQFLHNVHIFSLIVECIWVRFLKRSHCEFIVLWSMTSITLHGQINDDIKKSIFTHPVAHNSMRSLLPLTNLIAKRKFELWSASHRNVFFIYFRAALRFRNLFGGVFQTCFPFCYYLIQE